MTSIDGALKVLDLEDVEKIHNLSIELLWEHGIKVTSAKGREILLDHGGAALKGERVGIRPELVEKSLSSNAPFSLRSNGPGGDLKLLAGNCYVHNFGSAPVIVDSVGAVPRPSTLKDLIKSVKILDRLTSCDLIYPLVTPTDAPAELARIISVATCLQNTSKPVAIPVLNGEETKAAIRLIKAAESGQKAAEPAQKAAESAQVAPEAAPESPKRPSRAIITLSPISPLTFNDDFVETLLAAAGHQVPLQSLPCPILGLTAPMSMAGGLVTQNMESLAFATLWRLIEPKGDMIYGARLGFANMRTGSHMDGRPEKGLLGAAAAQLARKYRLPSDVYGMATGGHAANDVQTGYDKAIGAFQAMTAKADFTSGLGCLGHAVVTSLEMLVIDDEIFKMLKKVMSGIKVDKETLAREVIEQASETGFLNQRHTLKHIRSGEIYLSALDRQLTYEKWLETGRQGVYDSAQAEVVRLLSLDDQAPQDQAVSETFKEIVSSMKIEDYSPDLRNY
ncbi:MAG: trimethylamine methyltransferase family protein [Deltaproteobacteria bacterium]|jgi:trimethylamine--corrinoid protein Co-methyltransferase|nr:trimethylamine methyltransferase family protein [Deltaproteobacteria bacterium]